MSCAVNARATVTLLAVCWCVVPPRLAGDFNPYGINSAYWSSPSVNAAYRAMGVGTARVLLDWASAEPVYGGYDWSTWDTALVHCSSHGFAVSLAVYGVPAWAIRVPGRELSYAPEAFAEFVCAALNRARTLAPGIVQSFEWHEEPTHAWADGMSPLHGTEQRDPSQYFVAILTTTYRAVKQAFPEVAVVMDGIRGAFHHVDDLYQLGCGPYCDAINIHQYQPHAPGYDDPSGMHLFHFPTLLTYLRFMANRWGDDKPVWVTQYSWTTSGWGWGDIGEDRKAAYMEYVTDVSRRLGFVHRVFPELGVSSSTAGAGSAAVVYDDGNYMPGPASLSVVTTAYLRLQAYAQAYPVWTGVPEPVPLLPAASRACAVTNSGFESGAAGWSGAFSVDASTRFAGAFSARVDGAGGYIESARFALEGGRLYEVKARVKVDAPAPSSAAVWMELFYSSAPGHLGYVIPENYYGVVDTRQYPGGWRRVCWPYFSAPGACEAFLKFSLQGEGTFWLDDVTVRPLTMSTVPVATVIPSAVHAGVLGVGDRVSATVLIVNAGSEDLAGVITTDRPWITVSTAAFTGDVTAVTVSVDNGLLRASSGRHAGAVTVSWQGGSTAVPVSFDAGGTGVSVTNAYPNPFSDAVTFRCVLDAPAEVRVRVYTMDGRLIRSIAVRGATGDNRILWDGCNQQGMQVANGPYLYQVEVWDSQGVRRVSGKVARLR